MLFGKRKNESPKSSEDVSKGNHGVIQGEFYPIDFDMLLKGPIFDRKMGKIRQVTVTVDGATRLVTSGDVVNRDTLDALIASGAVRAPKGYGSVEAGPEGVEPVVEDAGPAESVG